MMHINDAYPGGQIYKAYLGTFLLTWFIFNLSMDYCF